MNWTRFLWFCLAFMGVSLGLAVPSWAQISPLDKDGSLYLVREVSGSSPIFKLDRSTQTYTLTQYAPAFSSSTKLNALGYNRKDGFMYVLNAPTNGTLGLYRIGKSSPTSTSGVIESLGPITNSPAPYASYNAADVSTDGYFYFSNSNTGKETSTLYRIDLNNLGAAPFAVTAITLDKPVYVGDFAFGNNGLIYATSVDGKYIYDITVSSLSTNATVNRRAVSNTPANLQIGSVFFDGAGELYAYNNSGGFYIVDIAGASFGAVSSSTSVAQSDGASVTDTPEFLDVIKSNGAFTQIDARTFEVPYVVGVKNTGTVTAANVQVNDNLRQTFSSGNPTLSIVSNPKLTTTQSSGITPTLNPNFNGETDTKLFSGTDDYPPGALARVAFTVRLTYPTVADVPSEAQLNSAYVSSVAGTIYTNPGYSYTPEGIPVAPINALTGEASSPGTAFPATPNGDAPGGTGTTLPPVALSGRVYEDVNFGGGAGRAYNGATPGMAGVANARVEIYNASGAFIGFTTSASDGTWSYAVASVGNYYARVVNGSVTSTRPGSSSALRGVQTFRTNNGVAVTNEVGGRAPASVDAGNGGATTTLDTSTFVLSSGGQAQTVAQIVVADTTTDREGFDFGFNFDLIVNTNDAGQGSLRQFILNSNALTNANLDQVGLTPGKETSLFQIPTARLTSGQMVIAPATPLPAISDADTTLSGLRQTAFSGDTAPADTSNNSGATTGPEVVLDLGTIPSGAANKGPGLWVTGARTIVEGLGITGVGVTTAAGAQAGSPNGVGILVQGSGAGSPVTGANPGGTILRNNTVYNNRSAGIRLDYGASNITVQNNVTRGVIDDIGDGIELEFGVVDSLFENNRSLYNAGYGVDIHSAPSNDRNTFGGNTFRGNGAGPTGVTDPAKQGAGIGIRLGNRNVVTGNTFYQNNGDGIVVRQNSTGNLISQNTFYANAGLAIDLVTGGANTNNGDDISPNDGQTNATQGNSGIDYPVFTAVQQSGADLRVQGYVGNLAAGSATFGGAKIEFYWADNVPANQNGAVVVGDGKSVAHGEGRTYLLSATADANGRFDVTLPNQTLGTNQITATATDGANNTSEFGANSGLLAPPVTPGGGLSGLVYLDANRNGALDNGETGTGLSGLYVKLVPQGATSASAIAAVDATTGAYAFAAPANGNYTLVLASNDALSDTAAAAPANYTFSEAPGGARTVNVNAPALSGLNFGLYQGAAIAGRVFKDDGSGSGLEAVRLELRDANNAVLASATTDGTGAYAFAVPAGASGNLRVVETNPAGFISASGSPGTAAGAANGSYNRATDTIAFALAAGQSYSGLNFGDVPQSALTNDGSSVGTRGTSVFYPHVFTAGGAGSVTFALSGTAAPANGQWNSVLYRDTNNNGQIDAGEAQISGPIPVAAGEKIALVTQTFVPLSAPDGAVFTSSLNASFVYDTITPILTQTLARQDLTTVGQQGNLKLVKTVDKTQAKSGDQITYTISYTNASVEALNTLVIFDATPAFTTFVSATNGALPAGLTGVTLAAPAVNASGSIRWTFAGSLASSASGVVKFVVKVQ